MVQTCSKCSRANPGEAVYCYFDGFVLGGHGRNGGPVAVGSQEFANPFVFPNGRQCRTFDQLALGCQEEWSTACDMLGQGFFENFFGGLGRVDLALAAREAARFPDRERGLDQLLGKLPSDVLAEPQLRIEPAEVHLGVLAVGATREFELHLENQGMRLLYGRVSCADPNSAWLGIGDANATEKHFQFGHEATIPIHVRGDRLRAGNKPLEARLEVESNGGNVLVTVRADVPVKPFLEGVLAGAKSPRQVAEKAKAKPKEAAPLFENGAVAEWYQSNGWTYPVQGPAASGMGAVQQFFEALGLTAPPKVEISEKAIDLSGNAGETLQHTLEVKSQEKRPVYAHATSNVPWLEVGRPHLSGRVAIIKVCVPAIPDHPGETLKGQLVVQSNGNQRFVVPVTLQVGGFNFDLGAPTRKPVAAPPPLPAAAPAAEGEPDITPAVAAAVPPSITTEAPRIPRSARHRAKPWWTHALPAALLGVVLLGVLAFDAFGPARNSPQGRPRGARGSHIGLEFDIIDPDPLLTFNPNRQNLRFGLQLLQEKDPANPDKFKRLTYKPDGSSNNTCVKIDRFEHIYGLPPGRQAHKAIYDDKRHVWVTAWLYPEDGIEVEQIVQLVPGEQTNRLDTCLVRYRVENKSQTSHKVGLRVMLDTYIGATDGVPFVIPGRKEGLLQQAAVFGEKQIPDYVQALEKPDLKNPGTVAHLGLKGFEFPGVAQVEPIVKMVICTWPGSETKWDLFKEGEDPSKKPVPIKDDSCVGLYWDYRVMDPGEKREMAFSYGLNAISHPEGEGGNLALTVGGSFTVGKDFTVTALVKQAQAGQKVKLTLPPGLELLPEEQDEQDIPQASERTQVSWRVHSTKPGDYVLHAASGPSRAQYKITVTARGLFR